MADDGLFELLDYSIGRMQAGQGFSQKPEKECDTNLKH
jgi:hypothetical protein